MMQTLSLSTMQGACCHTVPKGSWGAEGGSSTVELALLLPVLVLMLIGVVDMGRGCYLAMEVSHSAYAGAIYGSQNTADVAGMQAAAVADAPDVPGFSTSNVTATTGCECSDGSSPSVGCAKVPTCSANKVTFVQVNTAFTYQIMTPYPGIPNTLHLTGSSRMRAEY